MSLRNEVIKVIKVAELRMNRIVASLSRTNGIGRTGITGQRVQRVVTPLTESCAYGMNWCEVNNRKTHLRDGPQTLRRGGQRSRDPSTRFCIKTCAFGARKHFIPRTKQCDFA